MVPFAMALREVGGPAVKTFSGIPADDTHNIQTHASYMAWLVSSVDPLTSPSTNVWYKNVSKISGDIEANPRWNH